MSIQVKSGASAAVLSVDANAAAFVQPRDQYGNALTVQDGVTLPATQGFLLNGIDDDGVAVAMRGDRYGSVGIASVQQLLAEPMISTTVNPLRWTTTVTTFAIAQTVLGITLNSGGTTTASAAAALVSASNFQRRPRQPMEFRARLRLSQVANSRAEFGFGAQTSTTGVVPNGAFWRADGMSAVPVLAVNSVEFTGSAVDLSAFATDYLLVSIVIDDGMALYRITNTETGAVVSQQSMRVRKSAAKVSATWNLPIFFRLYNSATPPATAPLLSVGEVTVSALDCADAMPISVTAARNRDDAGANPSTGVQNSTFANSAAPANGTLGNTAASYSTLGGLFSFVAVAGATTDYPLFSYTPPKDFVCTGLHIATWNTVAAVATTPTLMVWGIGTDGATANLATGAHIRQALGSQSLPIGLVAGGNVPDIDIPIEPSLTRSGRSLAVILRMPVATATATQVIQGLVNVRGYHL